MLQEIQSLLSVSDRIETGTRRALARWTLWLVVGCFSAAAIGFAAAGLYLWLAMTWPTHLAALWVAGAFILASLLVLLSVRLLAANESASGGGQNRQSDSTRDIQAIAAEVADQALAETRRNPLGMVTVALTAGVIAGLFGVKNQE